MVAATPVGARVQMPRLTDIELCAWIAQAEAGARIEYHRGFLAVDTDRLLSSLMPDARDALCSLADAAFRAAEQNLVHLLQTRLGPSDFAYLAVARPKSGPARAALSRRLLEAA